MAKRGRKPVGSGHPANAEELFALQQLLKDKDYGAFAVKLASLVRTCGIKYVADQSGIRRESLYRLFANGKEPRLEVMLNIAKAIGLQMTTEQKKGLKRYFSDRPYENKALAKRLEQAKAFGREEKYDEAESIYDAILAEHPNCWEAKSGKGSVALARGECGAGEQIFRQLLDEYSDGPDGLPKNPEACSIAYQNLGAILSQTAADPFSPGALEKRILCYRLAVDLTPEDEFAVGLLCMNLIFWGRPGLARRYYLDAGQEMHEKIRASMLKAFESLPSVSPDRAFSLFNWLYERD